MATNPVPHAKQSTTEVPGGPKGFQAREDFHLSAEQALSTEPANDRERHLHELLEVAVGLIPRTEFPKPTEEERKRFWGFVAEGSEDDCWEWQGATGQGYGRFRLKGTNRPAHVVSLLMASPKKRRRKGKWMGLHRCSNKRCVNPNHLYWGDEVDNRLDEAGLTRRKVKRIYERSWKGQDAKTIAKDYNISEKTVSHIRLGRSFPSVTGHEPPPKPEFSAEWIDEICKSEESAKVLAQQYGVSRGTIDKHRRKKLGPRQKRLSEDQKDEIRTSKESTKVLAERYEVTPTTIYYHRRRDK